MRYHNPYKFETLRRSRRLGCRNANSGYNRSDPDVNEVFNCVDNSSMYDRDQICSFETAALPTKQWPRDEQVKGNMETRDLFKDILNGSSSEDELSNTFERFFKEDENYALVICFHFYAQGLYLKSTFSY